MFVRQRREPARRRRLDGVLTRPRVLWINASGTEFGGTPLDGFAERLRPRVEMTLLGLRVWGMTPGARYGMDVEVAAVVEAARSEPCHLAGFSAGATVALAAALALGDSVRSVALVEPASIGCDDWDPAEAEWRAAIESLGASPPEGRTAALRDLLTAPGVAPPPSRNPPRWDFRDDLLAAIVTAQTGFTSSDLAGVRAPILLIRGGRSSPRWGLMAGRLAAVCPDASEYVFPALHHFAPPYREEPQRFADVLLDFWLAG